MRHLSFSLTLIAAAVLAGCGGGSATDPAPKIKFTSQVSFGDSLSDVGTYKVGAIAALGGGKYTVNGATAKNWTELVASSLSLPAPCAAQTGLDGSGQGFSVPVANHTGCTGYAQGGARVTNPVGPGNKLLGGGNAVLGQLTVPVVTQIQNHLAAIGGKFKGDELVLVSAGPNDVFMQTAALSAAATTEGARVGAQTFASTLISSLAAGATNPTTAAQAISLAFATEAARVGHTDESIVGAAVTAAATQPGNSAVASPAVYGPMVVAAKTAATTAGNTAGAAYASANAQTYVDAIGTAATELAGYVNNLILAKGAKYVVVVNMPDISKTPSGLAQSESSKKLLNGMAITFNARLLADLVGKDNVIVIDQFTRFNDQVANPTAYGLTNVTTPACNLAAPGNPLGSSLVCNANNVITGDISKYYFADSVHPTPYANSLAATLITDELKKRGWL